LEVFTKYLPFGYFPLNWKKQWYLPGSIEYLLITYVIYLFIIFTLWLQISNNWPKWRDWCQNCVIREEEARDAHVYTITNCVHILSQPNGFSSYMPCCLLLIVVITLTAWPWPSLVMARPVTHLSCHTINYLFLAPSATNDSDMPTDWDGWEMSYSRPPMLRNPTAAYTCQPLMFQDTLQHSLITALLEMTEWAILHWCCCYYWRHGHQDTAQFLTTIMQWPSRCLSRKLWNISRGQCGVCSQCSSSSNIINAPGR